MIALQVSIFLALSLDGYVARSDGSLDWLDKANERVTQGEDCGFSDFLNSIDLLIMGRKTFEQVLSFGSWPYKDKRVLVLTRTGIDIPIELQKTVSTYSGEPKEILAKAYSDGATHIYLDGAETIQRFLQAGLVDDMTLTIVPVLLGSGIPLFTSLQHDQTLTLTDSKIYDFGYVQLKYHCMGASHK